MHESDMNAELNATIKSNIDLVYECTYIHTFDFITTHIILSYLILYVCNVVKCRKFKFR